MTTQQSKPEYNDDDQTTVSVTYDTLDELHDRRGRGDTLNDVIRREIGLE